MPNTEHTDDPEKSFSDRILECIGNQSRSAWGKSIDLNPGLLDRIFRQKIIPSHQNLLKIADALGVSIDWLLRGGYATKFSHTLFSSEEINCMESVVKIIRNPVTKDSMESVLKIYLKVEEEVVVEKHIKRKKKRIA